MGRGRFCLPGFRVWFRSLSDRTYKYIHDIGNGTKGGVTGRDGLFFIKKEKGIGTWDVGQNTCIALGGNDFSIPFLGVLVCMRFFFCCSPLHVPFAILVFILPRYGLHVLSSIRKEL